MASNATSDDDRRILHRQRFFEKSVFHPKVRDCLSGNNELEVIRWLESMEFKEGIDFVRQHPIGERFVIDIAFIKEQVALEVDGKSHDHGKQKRKDRARDKYLGQNNWIPIRIRDHDMVGYRGSFYKSLIKQIVDERHAQWNIGALVHIDIPNYVEKDYE